MTDANMSAYTEEDNRGGAHKECLFLQRLNKMREREHLTDICITAGDQRVMCHKIVLSLTCPYFKSLFELQSEDNRFEEVQLPDNLSPDAVKLLIDYLYTGELSLTQDNTMSFLETADFFELPDLIEACASILMDQIDGQNCLMLEGICDQKSLDKIGSEARRFALSHFTEVMGSEAFLNITFEQMCSYLEDSILEVSQKDLLKGLCEWLLVDVDTRLQFIGRLMTFVDQFSIDKMELKDIICAYPFMKEHLWSAQLIQPEVAPTKTPSDTSAIHNMKKVLVAIPQNTVEMQQCLTNIERNVYSRKEIQDNVYFPQSSEYSKEIWYLCLEENEWKLLTKVPSEKSYALFSHCVLSNMLYLCGGMDRRNREITAQSIFYDVGRERWQWSTDMLYPRHSHGAAAVQGQMYVVGGLLPKEYDEHCHKSSAEVFNPATEQWTLIKDPMGATYGLEKPCVIPVRDCIFVFGGCDITTKDDHLLRNHFYCEIQGAVRARATQPRYYSVHTGKWHMAGGSCLSELQRRGCVEAGDSMPYQDGILFKDFHLLQPGTGNVTVIGKKPRLHNIGGFFILNDTLYCIQGIENDITPVRQYDPIHDGRIRRYPTSAIGDRGTKKSRCIKLARGSWRWENLPELPVGFNKWHLLALDKVVD